MKISGGHPFSFTGVFEISPRDHDELGEQFRFRYAIVIWKYYIHLFSILISWIDKVSKLAVQISMKKKFDVL